MRVDVSAKYVSFPPACVCCLGHPDAPIRSFARGKAWPIPHCSACLRHAAAAASASSWVLFGGLGGAAVGFVAIGAGTAIGGASLGIIFGAATFALGLFVGYLMQNSKVASARAMCSPSCWSLTNAAAFVGWRGHVHSFAFANPHYAVRFMDANSEKLVNLAPDARQALSWHLSQKAEAARAEAHVASQRAAEQRAHLDAMKVEHAARLEEIEIPVWLARLETARGPASRREVLARALAVTTRADLRDRLMLEASQVEVRAALDKADGLKTPAAKRRVLQEALAAIRADSVPDDLQADQIRWLEEALAEVDA